MQRRIACVLGPYKLCGDEKPNIFVVIVLSSFSLCFPPSIYFVSDKMVLFFFNVVVCCHFDRVCLAVTERFWLS